MIDLDKFTVATEIVVPFHDLDSVNVVWHGRYVKYLELARCELLDRINYSYTEMLASGYLWPVVDMRIKYISPLVWKQKIRVIAAIKEWEYRLKLDYRILDASTGETISKAYTIQVACDINTKEMLYETPLPLRQALGIL